MTDSQSPDAAQEHELRERAGEEVFNRRGKPMRMLLLDPATADKIVEDIQVLHDDVAEEVSDMVRYEADTSGNRAAADSLQRRAGRLTELLSELQLTRVIVASVEEDPDHRKKRLEDELVEQIAETWFDRMCEFDDDSVVEMMEDHMALFDMVPLVPLDHDDEQVMAQYKAYEEAERQLYRRAWLAYAKKLIEKFEETA